MMVVAVLPPIVRNSLWGAIKRLAFQRQTC
jgi:hypothetical protein